MSTRKQELQRNWKLCHFPQESIAAQDVLNGSAKLEWIEAEVPGNVLLDLHRANLIPDPFMGMNPEVIRPLEFHEFWYQLDFTNKADTPAGGRLNLLFEGIDTFAEVYLDGELVGTTHNSLIPQRIEITGRSASGRQHRLHIRIKSDLYEVAQKDFEGAVEIVTNEPSRLWIRKAQHAHGWNIFPRLQSNGLWQRVYLEIEPPYYIDDVFVFTKQFGVDECTIMARAFIKTPQVYRPDLRVRLRMLFQDEEVYTETYPMQFPAIYFKFQLPEPKLWWPRPYGLPNLYDVQVELLEPEGSVISRWDGSFGIRKIEIIQEPMPEGHLSFYFKINGEPISAYGTNHVPLDSFPGLNEQREAEFLALLDESNSNMIRIWGGGNYESDKFYDACDRMGVMIWHDFMFACALYPQHDEFLDAVREEARAVVRRLRNHPSLILWCGDNEIDVHLTHYFSAHQDGGNRAIANEILPEYLMRYDGTRPYWPSSPYTPIKGEPAHSVKGGDTHIWCHGLYYKHPVYTEDFSPFISEIGHLALVNRDSIKNFIPADKLWPYDREMWAYRCGTLTDPQSSCWPEGRLVQNEQNVENVFGAIPNNLEDFIIASQIVQAEAYKTWIERARRRKFSCGGILWWNLLDGCPQISDAVVDYYYAKKLGFEVICRVQEDILFCIEELENTLQLFLVNDRLEKRRVKYEVLLGSEKVCQGDVVLPPNASVKVDVLGEPTEEPRLFLLKAHCDGRTYSNHYLDGVPPFDLQWALSEFKAVYSNLQPAVAV